MGIIETHYAKVASYESTLATLDAKLLRLLKMFIHDLLDFRWAYNAGHRLEPKGFQHSKEHRNYYNAFCKAWRYVLYFM